jgi:thiosulfate sulfurtransferase
MSNVAEWAVSELQQAMQQGQALTIIDVRDPASYANGHIQGARNIPLVKLPSDYASVPSDTQVICCCYHGNSSKTAVKILMEHGFTSVASLQGGFTAWQEAKGACE